MILSVRAFTNYAAALILLTAALRKKQEALEWDEKAIQTSLKRGSRQTGCQAHNV
jgi:hypothetical protein